MPQIAIPKTKITMKDKREYLISREKGSELQSYLSGLSNHVFVKLSDLGITITTAEIKSVDAVVIYENRETKQLPERPITEEERHKIRNTIRKLAKESEERAKAFKVKHHE